MNQYDSPSSATEDHLDYDGEAETTTVEIVGHSMWPVLSDGEIVESLPRAHLEQQAGRWPPKVGTIVVARHPFRRQHLIVKRITAIDPRGYELRGEDPLSSEDSRSFGPVAEELLLGIVVPGRGAQTS